MLNAHLYNVPLPTASLKLPELAPQQLNMDLTVIGEICEPLPSTILWTTNCVRSAIGYSTSSYPSSLNILRALVISLSTFIPKEAMNRVSTHQF
ncbi:MAG: hypothetical protein V7L12_14605 [Nostoc sp.]